MVSSPSSPYKMTISLNTLNHLGINLYSNVPAVLSELVANAYDADAQRVGISISADTIIISDDGIGMTQGEVNERYLTIGYDRRRQQPGNTKKFNRPPMGRKGIGKLAVFSIADEIEVYSAKDGEASGLLMSRQGILDVMNDGGEIDRTYHPQPLSTSTIDFVHGTKLVLKKLRRQRTATLAVDYLKRRLARRFTIIGAKHDFSIYINDTEVTPRDRGFYSALEFIWFFGKEDEEVLAAVGDSLKSKEVLSATVDAASSYQISGWIGTVGEPSDLGDRSEEGNSIVIYARGKLVQENILQEFREARVFAQYLLGDINADFIDLDQEEDLATSDRQRLVADDPRYKSLKAHIEAAIRTIGLKWTDLRKEQGVKRALDNPVLKKWYSNLNLDHRAHAKKLFGKIESLPSLDLESKSELYRASILGFEKMALVGELSRLDGITSEDGFEALLAVFKSVDELEAAHYYEIVKGRLRVINEFTERVDANSKERVLQEWLFEHLWLLDAAWERATKSERLEQTVSREFDRVTSELTDEERRARIDIRYKTFAGKHVIVELKKADVRINVLVLASQIEKYQAALKKALASVGEHNPQIEIVCVLGEMPTGEKSEDILKVYNARYVTYDQLIYNAQTAYGEYLARQRNVSDISSLLDELEKSFKAQPID